jgi:hypothetical protein
MKNLLIALGLLAAVAYPVVSVVVSEASSPVASVAANGVADQAPKQHFPYD